MDFFILERLKQGGTASRRPLFVYWILNLVQDDSNQARAFLKPKKGKYERSSNEIMKLRLMTFQDFDSMYSLWKEAGLLVADYETEKELTFMMIKLNPKTNFVVSEEEKIIGTVLGVFNGRRGWVYHLAVQPKFQKQGLGSQLLKKAEEALKKIGAERVLLGVTKSNLKVLPFYEKFGYQEATDAIYLGKNI